jgi:outer membrane protein assembly factor BamE (lipoprotein component of BamABCDE complex)
MFLAMASAFLFACSESDDPSPVVDNSIPEGSVVFDISTVNKLNNGMSRGNVYSQEATQHVTRVSVYAFSNNGSDYVYAKTYDISGWSDGTTFKRYVVAEGDKLPAGDYKFLAVGRDAADQFTVTSPSAGQSYSSMMATIAQSGNESEIFSGTTTAQVLDKGSRVSIEMTRKVAGVLGYFKNVPQILDGKTVTFLRLSASNSNQQVNLTNGVGVNTSPAAYNIIDLNLSGQTVTNGIYTGNNLSAQGVVKVANSQLSGSYFMPVSSVTLTLGLYEANGNAIKTWSVKDTGGVTTFNILANHFYSLGMKAQAGNVNGGTDDPGDDDDPIDLLTDQNIVITISPAWELIHNLIIQ